MSTGVVIKVLCIIGFSISTVCLLLQLFIYLLVPCSRQLAQKLLTHLSVARLLYVIFEYITINVRLRNWILNDVVFGLYFQIDAVMVCCMFVFTKNMYNDIADVFAKKQSFRIVAAAIWCITIPVGILCALSLDLDGREIIKIQQNPEIDLSRIAKPNNFYIFYKVYGVVKFLILTVNLVMFCCIFKVVLQRKDRASSMLKICVVSFILVSISSIHVFTSDLLTFFLDEAPEVSVAFEVIHSYQVILITGVFVVMTQNVCKFRNETLKAQITKKLVEQRSSSFERTEIGNVKLQI